MKKQKRTPEEAKNAILFIKYGITIYEWNKMFAIQGGCCKICHTHSSATPKGLCVDHCHKTQKVRGLICNSCNIMLARAKDDTEILEAAIAYLKGDFRY